MNEAVDPLQERIVGAVQRELDRFGAEIAERFGELQRHAAAETSARVALEARLGALTDESATADHDVSGAVAGVEARLDRLEEHLDIRLAQLDDASEQRQTDLVAMAARLDDRATALENSSTAAEDRIASMAERADAAANDLTERVTRFDEDREAIDARLERLDRRRNDASDRLEVLEERLGRIDEIVREATVGIADRVEQLAIAQETMAKQTTDELEAVRAAVAEIDPDAIEEVQDRVSSALGQAELVRIEMDRFKEKMQNDLDANVSRLTAIETEVQDQRMDVESAVQLERLEEVERMVLMLDPEITAQRSTISEVDEATAQPGGPGATTGRTDTPSVPRLAPSTET